MARGQRLSGTTAGAAAPPPDGALPICGSAELAERGRAIAFDVLHFRRPVRAFALRVDGVAVAYLNRCGHVPVELDWQPGEFWDAERERLVCSLHGATYAPRTGACVGGPCRTGLAALDVAERDGTVWWTPSRDIRPPGAGPAIANGLQ